MNFINEYKMIYVKYSKFRITLMAEMEKPEPLTEEDVRRAVMRVINQTLDWGQDPYAQAEEMKQTVDLVSWTEYLPHPESQEQMEDPKWKNRLADWIMSTEQMREALALTRGSTMDDEDINLQTWKVEKKEMDEMTMSNLLLDLIQPTEDFQ